MHTIINKPLDFKFWEDILYYDGPLLSLCITEDKTHVLFLWIDKQGDDNMYAYIYLTPEAVEQLLKAEKSYHQTITESEQIIRWTDNSNQPSFETIALETFMEKYGPDADADLSEQVKAVTVAYEQFKQGTYEF